MPRGGGNIPECCACSLYKHHALLLTCYQSAHLLSKEVLKACTCLYSQTARHSGILPHTSGHKHFLANVPGLEHFLAKEHPPGHEHFLAYQHEVCNRYSNCLLVLNDLTETFPCPWAQGPMVPLFWISGDF